jgi:hypothetical protein
LAPLRHPPIFTELRSFFTFPIRGKAGMGVGVLVSLAIRHRKSGGWIFTDRLDLIEVGDD